MKTSQTQPLQRGSIQPWLRDQYQTLRTETGPRLEQARAVVMPVLTDASHKVRDELVPRVRDELVPKVRDEIVPATVQFSSRMADEAMQRSAPLRAELSDRANAAFAAARGQVTSAQIEQLKRAHGHRKLWLIGGAAAAGAALGTAAVLWQRSREQAWVEDDAVNAALSPSDAGAEVKRMDAIDRDAPSDPEGGTGSSASSSRRERQ